MIHRSRKASTQRVIYVDPGVYGNVQVSTRIGYPQALSEPDQVILTHELSGEALWRHTSN